MDYGTSTAGAAAIAGLIALYVILLGAALIFWIAWYVVTAFAFMSFFRKVGVKPWIGWVPFYNRWVWLEVGGQQGWLALLSLVPYGGIVAAVFLAIGTYRTGFAFRKDGAWVVLGIFLPFVWLFLLGRQEEVYDPSLIVAHGYPLPLAGYGSVTNNYANIDHVPPTHPAPPAAS